MGPAPQDLETDSSGNADNTCNTRESNRKSVACDCFHSVITTYPAKLNNDYKTALDDECNCLPMIVSLHDTKPRAVMTVSTRSVLALWSMC